MTATFITGPFCAPSSGRTRDPSTTTSSSDPAVRIRRAEPEDADFLAGLGRHEEVEPFVGPSAVGDRDAVLAAIERSHAEPENFGRFVIEVEEDGAWRRAGALGFHVASRHSRIAKCEGLAVHPNFRGRR